MNAKSVCIFLGLAIGYTFMKEALGRLRDPYAGYGEETKWCERPAVQAFFRTTKPYRRVFLPFRPN